MPRIDLSVRRLSYRRGFAVFTSMLLVVTAMIATFGTAVAGAAPATTGSISGTVTDHSDNPLSGASLEAETVDNLGNVSQVGATATSDASGNYTLTALPPGTGYIVEMDPNNGTGLDQWYDHAFASSAAAQVSVTAGGATTGIDFSDQAGVTVSGTVTDTAGTPVAGGEVMLTMVAGSAGNANGGYATVNSDGTFAATDIAPGYYTAEYAPDGTTGVVDTTFLNPFQVTTGDVSGLTFKARTTAPASGNTLEGRIVDSSGNPIAGIEVDAYSATDDSAPTSSATTGPDGTYSISGIAAYDRYYVRAFDPNDVYGAFDLAGIRLDDGDTTDGSVWFGDTDVYVMNGQMDKLAHITGTITDNQGQEVTDLMNIALVDPTTGDVLAVAQNQYNDPTHPGYYTTVVNPGTYDIEYLDLQSDPPPLTTQWWNGAVDQAHATPVTFAEGQSLNFDVTMEPNGAPGAPTNVTATAGTAQAAVAWHAPAFNGGSAITGYAVTSSPGSKTCTTTGAFTCTVSGLTNGTAYTFTVTATNAVGTSPASTPSNPVTPAAPATAPDAPTNVTATAGNSQATVAWHAPASNGGSAITGYAVTSSPGSKTCTTTGALTCTVTGLTNGTAYTFTVTATNAIGTSPASTPSNPVTPTVPANTANQSFVIAAYTDFIGRPPRSQEETYWASLLNAGTSRNTLTTELATSQEWVNHIVTQFYEDTLNRAPDAAGLAYWDSVLISNKQSVATVASEFYSSGEYFRTIAHSNVDDWITDLYTKLLHRSTDQDGLTYWAQVVQAKGRQSVAYGIYQSNESRSDRVTNLYDELLHRAPDASGLNYWTAKLTSTGDIALAEQLADSPEYFTLAHTRFP